VTEVANYSAETPPWDIASQIAAAKLAYVTAMIVSDSAEPRLAAAEHRTPDQASTLHP
jgi:hypothetical protein